MDKFGESRITPEKQLLKLIEDPDSENITKARVKYKAKGLFSLGFLKALNFSAVGGGQSFFKSRHALFSDIRGINLFLKVCIFGMAAYLVTYVVVSTGGLKTPPVGLDQVFKSRPSNGGRIAEIQPSIKEGSFYTDKIKVRDIFKPYEEEKPKKKEVKVKEEPKEVTPSAADFIGGLRLVGIAGEDNPDIIIENTKLNKTFFLKVGDEFCGAKVKKVLPDKVIVEYEGQELDLR